MLTAETLRDILDYDPHTGVFTWLVKVGKKTRVGAAAGTVRPNGYCQICISYRLYLAHRLAWLWMTGEWPQNVIDHINLNGCDNRWNNLRLATISQNGANIRAPSHNTSGTKGVHWDNKRRKWIAQIKVNRKLIFLGRFDTIESARKSYSIAAHEYFGEFARVA